MTSERINHWHNQLTGKLRAERVQGLSNAELWQCFKGCVAARRCYVMARLLRRYGLLTLADLV